MTFITDFADQAVVLPLALATALLLAASGWWRGFAVWLLAIAGVLGAILALKIVFAACANILAPTGIKSPSGHTASACVVYGGIAMLLLRGRLPLPLLILLPALIAALFGLTRLVLQVHTPGDVEAGALVGMAGIAGLAWLTGPFRPRHQGIAVLVTVLIMITMHGIHLHAETRIRDFALAGWFPMPASCHSQTLSKVQWLTHNLSDA